MLHSKFQKAKSVSEATKSAQISEPKPTTLKELLALSPAEIERCDIARMNLLCAEGLRGAEILNVESFLTRLDGIAKHVELETRRHYYRFQNNKAEFNHSEGYFRMLLMAVTLQEDLKIRYNPERITPVGVFEPNDVFFADCRDVFVHGMIAEDRRMGTCASMPVLYVTIGRRLGYPLKLVPTQNHLFVRWEDSRERFNVDATGRGMNMHDDEHYRKWPMPISRESEQEFGYLKSMTATDELTAFLSLRGACLVAASKTEEALAAQEAALRFSPNSRLQQMVLAKARQDASARAALSLLPSEQQPYWPRPRINTSFAPGPTDPNPLNAIRNQ
ncbi:MAG TPA: transglutaminase family protein [Candidatus Limnocylindria bacterium]|nr:transglutaminase family protein [Candidatus Limnocylindria bacterium]